MKSARVFIDLDGTLITYPSKHPPSSAEKGETGASFSEMARPFAATQKLDLNDDSSGALRCAWDTWHILSTLQKYGLHVIIATLNQSQSPFTFTTCFAPEVLLLTQLRSVGLY